MVAGSNPAGPIITNYNKFPKKLIIFGVNLALNILKIKILIIFDVKVLEFLIIVQNFLESFFVCIVVKHQ